jgi:hypothetical protein
MMATRHDGKRYFTVEEANELVPELEHRFGKVMQLRTQLRSTYEELERRGVAPDLSDAERMVRPLPDEEPDVTRLRGRFRALMEALAEELQAIEAAGVAVKDLEIGLCDFLGQRDGRDVWLCWQYGEKRIAHWHELDSGFAGRQPLDETTGRGRTPSRTVH